VLGTVNVETPSHGSHNPLTSRVGRSIELFPAAPPPDSPITHTPCSCGSTLCFAPPLGQIARYYTKVCSCEWAFWRWFLFWFFVFRGVLRSAFFLGAWVKGFFSFFVFFCWGQVFFFFNLVLTLFYVLPFFFFRGKSLGVGFFLFGAPPR